MRFALIFLVTTACLGQAGRKPDVEAEADTDTDADADADADTDADSDADYDCGTWCDTEVFNLQGDLSAFCTELESVMWDAGVYECPSTVETGGFSQTACFEFIPSELMEIDCGISAEDYLSCHSQPFCDYYDQSAPECDPYWNCFAG